MKFSSHKLNDWLADRPWGMFWRGLPVLLAVGGALLILAMFLAGQSRRSELRSRYRRSTSSALAAKNFEAARVICLRGLSFDSDAQTRLEWLFYLSIALNGLGHEQEAASLLATAAPEERLGCVQAHVAVAQMLLRSTNITEKVIRSAEHQLQNALALDPRSPEINEMLGRFYINTHQFDEARKRLLEVYLVKKEIALLLAITYNASGDSTSARTWSDTAIEVFGKNLKQASPDDSPADRLGFAQALSIQESYAEALKTLESGVALGENSAYGSAIADVCATWAEKMSAGSEGDLEKRFRLIQKGIGYAPTQPRLWMLLIQTARAPGDFGRQAKAMVDQLTTEAKGESAAMWHFLQWTVARETGDWDSARSHLRTAYQLAPQIPQIVNDMAMDLAFGAAPDPERALSIIEPTMGPLKGQFPASPMFRDTRGKILVRLGRYQEAVTDLEYASLRLQNATETRLTLAAAYDGLGKSDLAAQQRLFAAGSRGEEKGK